LTIEVGEVCIGLFFHAICVIHDAKISKTTKAIDADRWNAVLKDE